MKVLLLGSSGLLGHNVLRILLKENHEVVALLRQASKLKIRHPRLTIREASLTWNHILEVSEGCEAVINCAGTTDMALLHQEDYEPMNRDICKDLVRLLVERDSLRSLVHVSTANTIGYGTADCAATEASPMEFPFTESYYALSKREGEKILQEAAGRLPEKHIVIINPGFMIGAYDEKPSSGALLLAAYRKPLMVAPGGGKSFVHVADVAHATVNGLQMGRSGVRYIAAGENLSLKEFYALEAEKGGYRQYLVTLPDGLVGLAGRIGDLLRRAGIRTQLSTRNVRQLMVREYYDSSCAVRELHMPQTPIGRAIEDFFAYQCGKRHNK